MALISIDNGLHWYSSKELSAIWRTIKERNLMPALLEVMDRDVAECAVGKTDYLWLKSYLRIATIDICVG